MRRELAERFPRPSAPRRWWTEADHAAHATAARLLAQVPPPGGRLVEDELVFTAHVATLPSPAPRPAPPPIGRRLLDEPPQAVAEVAPVVWSGEATSARAAARAYAARAQSLGPANARGRRSAGRGNGLSPSTS
ncbi:hypothetical protein [Herbidospora cretacea]|uniref:hypothetical protein n=1 Tax=Herbidospora cretacea TaxID=28444 RepID=UPI0004C32D02|nr:hypothetical protein [Herbidospora cretacea]